MGAINLDNTGSGGAVTLTSDGTDLLLGGTAIGGAPALYAANPSSATDPTASGTNAVAIGTNAVASNTDSVALGSDSLSSGLKSFAAVIGNSYLTYGAQGAYSISIGLQTKANATGSVAVGRNAVATGTYSTSLGFGSTATGEGSIAIGDSGAAAGYATSIGKYALSSTEGKYSYASGRFASVEGSAQTGTFVLRSDTTDATPEALTTNNSAAAATNQVILPNYTAYAFSGLIVAREDATDGTDCAAWKIEGLIRREANAGTTVLVNSATTVLDNTPAWGMALTADTTNGGLAITITGAAATNIRWVATINTSEVIYA